MNRKLFPIALVLGLTAVLFSCKDDETGPSSSFTYDGKSYKLSVGYRDEMGEMSADVFAHDIRFLSKEVTASNVDSGFDFLDFRLYSSSENSLIDGTYNFYSAADVAEISESTFDYGYVHIGFNFSTREGDWYLVTGGSIDVSNNGKKFVFDLTLDDGKKVTGTFNGDLILE